MKIGFSFSRCIRDVVEGLVPVSDILVIIARTWAPTLEDIEDICLGYWSNLPPDEFNKYREVAVELFKAGKIHQPRSFGAHRYPVNESYVWMDVVPTLLDRSQAVTDAWDQYKMLIALSNDELTPSIEQAPKN